MRLRSSSRDDEGRFMNKSWLAVVAATVMMLPCPGWGGRADAALQNAGSGMNEGRGGVSAGEISLIVCDPPSYESCHRMVGVTRPKMIHSESPAYPAEARRLGMTGVSEVRFVIDPEGVPRNVKTAHSIADGVPASQRGAAIAMDRSAVACVKNFRFTPATLDGKPVATQVDVKMRFHRMMAQ
jgi:TonB family protein